MSLIYDNITAANVAGYFNNAQLSVDTALDDAVFPARKQLGIKMAYVKGASGRPVVIKPAAFDTNVTLRDRVSATIHEEEMPFFKEAMLVKEADRQQLNMLKESAGAGYLDVIFEGIFNDQLTLLQGAKARLKSMRMQALATGKITFESEGRSVDVDYGVEADHKQTVAKSWADADATPLADLESAIEKAESIGLKAEVAYMNSSTFAQIRKATSTVKIIKPLAGEATTVTKAEVEAYILDNYGIAIKIENGTYKNDKGEVVKYFPDGHLTLAPNASLGATVYGTTPEESDLMGGNSGVEVALVDEAIAVTTKKLDDPVNVQTKVSMIALPSFERVADCFFLTTIPVI